LGIRPDLLKCFGRDNGQGEESAASSLLSSSLQARSDNVCGIIAIEDITKFFFKATRREHAMQQEDPLIDFRIPLETIYTLTINWFEIVFKLNVAISTLKVCFP
jgi:hypothetical protein